MSVHEATLVSVTSSVLFSLQTEGQADSFPLFLFLLIFYSILISLFLRLLFRSPLFLFPSSSSFWFLFPLFSPLYFFFVPFIPSVPLWFPHAFFCLSFLFSPSSSSHLSFYLSFIASPVSLHPFSSSPLVLSPHPVPLPPIPSTPFPSSLFAPPLRPLPW